MTIRFGSPRNDFLQGTQDSDVLFGGAGNDTIYAYVDPVRGSSITSARASITDHADVVFGGAGNDSISAGGGNDIIFGGAGRDTIDGGPGVDQMWGGAGADVFKFEVLFASPGAPTASGPVGEGQRDVIHDFHQGQDLIDLRGWENSEVAGGSRFIGTETPLFDPNLQVAYHFEDGNTVVDLARLFFVPQPGYHGFYSGPSGQIEITGEVCLQASDFIL